MPSPDADPADPAGVGRLRDLIAQHKRRRLLLLMEALEKGEASVAQVDAVLTPEEKRYLDDLVDVHQAWLDDPTTYLTGPDLARHKVCHQPCVHPLVEGSRWVPEAWPGSR